MAFSAISQVLTIHFFFFFAYHIPIILVSFHQMWLKKSHQLAFLSEIVGNYEGATL